MKTYTDQQISQMYDNLPEDLKEAIFSVDMSEIVEKIGKENQLNIEQVGNLANETGMVMLGVTHPNEFIANLADRLEVDKEKARVVAGEINDQIFKPVRESIRKIHNIREEEKETVSNVKVSPFGNYKGEILKTEHNKEDILKDIEKDYTKEEGGVPNIMRGDANPFEDKMKEGVFKVPTEERHYIEEKPEEKRLEAGVASNEARKENQKQPPANLPTQEKSKNYQAIDPYREQIE